MNPSANHFVTTLENTLIPVKSEDGNESETSISYNIHNRMNELHISGISIVLLQNNIQTHHLCYGKSDTTTDLKINKKSIFHACSISKFITALAVMKLIEQKFLDLDTPIKNYLTSWIFPENEFTKKTPVTIRHLLSHQAGIIDPEGSFDVYNPQTPYPTNLDILTGVSSYHEGEVHAQSEPNTKFHYSDGGFCVLEQIVVDILQKPFALVIKELIFQPLNIHDAFYHDPTLTMDYSKSVVGHNSTGDPITNKYPIYPYMAAAGLWISPTSLAKIVIQLSLSLQGKGKLLTDVQLVKEMVTSQGCFAHVGLGVFLDGDCPEPMVISNGWGVGFQANIIAFPQTGSASIIMMNAEPGKSQRESIIGEIYRGIGKILEWPGF
ncbi:hypothetical protein NEF87_003709 [Candidatus Lokiarchaeum ossiferum]|uniref:Beta-lactamase-related domain-containing protein n=1 Tax=Candidatus Lokiarchaeum ossiferum TaxID=2951803 RepID=A0ABY6HV76_9ARCH|nr:hypothetical protein NEF87_003709 [Candidatus Lokiarchaeum sp. B-35]